jgi:hypothetical protein
MASKESKNLAIKIEELYGETAFEDIVIAHEILIAKQLVKYGGMDRLESGLEIVVKQTKGFALEFMGFDRDGKPLN